MNLPLPSNKTHKSANTAGNQGLYFNKFFNQWTDNYDKVKKPTQNFAGGKRIWFNNFTKAEGAPKNAERIKDMVEGMGGKTREYTNTGPFITGMGLSHPVENGFLWHHTLGVPYLPGSSIKGMIRAWADHWETVDAKDIGRIFGRNDKAEGGAAAGNIIVFDALPTTNLELYTEVMTPHDDGWRIAPNPTPADAPSDWKSPVPIPFLAIQSGAKFQFALAARKGANKTDLATAFGYLELALEWIGAGAKTAIGFGRFESDIGRDKRQSAEDEAKKNAPPGNGDRVRVLATYKKMKLRGREGTCLGENEFGEMEVEWDGGGISKLPPDQVEKLL